MRTNQELKNAALAALKCKWTPAVLCALVYSAIVCGPTLLNATESWVAMFISYAFSICVALPLGVGIYSAYRSLLVSGDAKVTENVVRDAFGNWGHNVAGMLLMTIYIVGWTLLLIVPGIIKSLSYALTPFILVDNPELSADGAIVLSMKMMDGHKLDFFILCLSFIGWGLLCILTLGIGFFWLIPYQYTAVAAFYEDVKAEYESKAVAA